MAVFKSLVFGVLGTTSPSYPGFGAGLNIGRSHSGGHAGSKLSAWQHDALCGLVPTVFTQCLWQDLEHRLSSAQPLPDHYQPLRTTSVVLLEATSVLLQLWFLSVEK